MKKVMYGGLVFASLMLAAMACQKENVQPNPATQSAQVGKSVKSFDTPQEKSGPPTLYRKWYDTGTSWGCFSTDGPCHPDVVVKPALISVVDTIVTQNNKGNVSGVISTIQNNFNDLSTIISQGLLSGVINRQLDLKVRGLLTQSSTVYFLFCDHSNGNLVTVQPLKEKE